ncbi:MAG: ATP-binding cassette domain-containing protein [Bacteroidota bacterium]|nr:ATP-binding cassette domain-containing protein [Bacteroidota bacterium]
MQIDLIQAGIRFGNSWVARNITYTFKQGCTYALLGNNGSGKSSLLQLIAGNHTPTEGQVEFEDNGKKIPPERFFKSISLVAPYLSLPEELTVSELLNFHSHFKKSFFSAKEITEFIWLDKDRSKEIRQLSSGMKQRLKLGLGFFYHSSVLLFDEPITHLDSKGIEWYEGLIEKYTYGRTIIVASNQHREYGFCAEIIDLESYKPAARIKQNRAII